MATNEKYKQVLLGESNVGKTSILKRFDLKEFDPNVEQSNGASYITRVITLPDNNTITFDIWDTSGQKKYRALTRIFYKDAKGVLLVYDPTDEESFKELKDYWYNEVKNPAINIVIAIVANKSDIDEKVVQDEDGEKFAESIGAIFASVSAKDDIGISDLLERMGQINPSNN